METQEEQNPAMMIPTIIAGVFVGLILNLLLDFFIDITRRTFIADPTDPRIIYDRNKQHRKLSKIL